MIDDQYGLEHARKRETLAAPIWEMPYPWDTPSFKIVQREISRDLLMAG